MAEPEDAACGAFILMFKVTLTFIALVRPAAHRKILAIVASQQRPN